MRFLYLIDPPGTLKAYKDTTVAMMRAAQARGHEVWVAGQPDLHWNKGRVQAHASRLTLADNDEDWYRAHEAVTRTLASFGAVLMRKDPPFDLEYVVSTWLLSAAVREGARVFNAPDAIRDHNEKLAVAEFGRFVGRRCAQKTVYPRGEHAVGRRAEDGRGHQRSPDPPRIASPSIVPAGREFLGRAVERIAVAGTDAGHLAHVPPQCSAGALACPVVVTADVGRDAMEPGLEGALAAVGATARVDGLPGFLEEILLVVVIDCVRPTDEENQG